MPISMEPNHGVKIVTAKQFIFLPQYLHKTMSSCMIYFPYIRQLHPHCGMSHKQPASLQCISLTYRGISTTSIQRINGERGSGNVKPSCHVMIKFVYNAFLAHNDGRYTHTQGESNNFANPFRARLKTTMAKLLA